MCIPKNTILRIKKNTYLLKYHVDKEFLGFRSKIHCWEILQRPITYNQGFIQHLTTESDKTIWKFYFEKFGNFI